MCSLNELVFSIDCGGGSVVQMKRDRTVSMGVLLVGRVRRSVLCVYERMRQGVRSKRAHIRLIKASQYPQAAQCRSLAVPGEDQVTTNEWLGLRHL
jgi:hypothetical protein